MNPIFKNGVIAGLSIAMSSYRTSMPLSFALSQTIQFNVFAR